MAIFYPDCEFTLVDSIGKKILVVQDVIEKLGLKNVHAFPRRGEELKEKFDFVTNRAVAPVSDIMRWTHKLISPKHLNAMPNGILCLKGGDLAQEIFESNCKPHIWEVTKVFNEDYFENKFLLNVL